MDILYSDKVNGFCIVSSDSDFTRLATRLREAGMRVIGFGRKKHRSLLFRPAISSSTWKFLTVALRPKKQLR